MDAFNIDDRCAALTGSYVGIDSALRARVGRECEAFIANHIATRRSFVVETTLHGEPPFQAAIAQRGKLAMLDAATPEWLAAVGLTRNH